MKGDLDAVGTVERGTADVESNQRCCRQRIRLREEGRHLRRVLSLNGQQLVQTRELFAMFLHVDLT